MKATYTLDISDQMTILAALRMFQEEFEGDHADAIRERFPDYFNDDAGEPVEPLGTEDIDTLCEQINCADRIELLENTETKCPT